MNFKKLYILKKANKYIKLENEQDFNSLKIKIKWVLKQSKPIIPYTIAITIINTFLSIAGVYSALVSKSLIDSAIGGNTSKVIQWLIVMATIMFGKMAISPITSILSTKTSNNFNHRMQEKIYTHISCSQWLPLSKHHSISLLTRIDSDVITISSTILNTIPNLITLIITFIVSFSTLIYFAPSIALTAIIITPLLFIISKVFGNKLKILYNDIQEENVKYKSFIQESLQNIMIVKTFCMEKRNFRKLKEIQINKYDLAMKNAKVGICAGLSLSFSSTLVYFIIFCWGAINISKGTSTYGTFTAMLQLYNSVQGPLSSLAKLFPSLIGCIAAAERLMELENLPLESDFYQYSPEYIAKPTIKFEDVSFEYNKNLPVLENINLVIEPGEIIGLIGLSGQGKTTLIRLLLSLIYPQNGKITINDIPLNKDHRKLISYVPQGNTLFTGTIEENLRYGKADATSTELENVLKNACAYEFVFQLKEGIHTHLSENNVGLSQGESQRICIARALLRKNPILILDEVTSALDMETELKVITSIKNLEYKPSCIIITHRPSALAICNKIYNLTSGTIHHT